MIFIATLVAFIPPRCLDADDRFQQQVLPLLQTYCYGCHGDGAEEGSFSLDSFTSQADAHVQPQVWWKVLKNLRASTMPPAGEDRPTEQELATIVAWIKFDVFGIDPHDPDPGRLSVRRLNRTEYGNTVRALMGVDFDAELHFPPDDSGYGFDNVGDALMFSPLLMEKYLQAARLIVGQAVPTVTKIIPRQDFSGADFAGDEGVVGDRLDGKRAARVSRTVVIDRPGRYAVHVGVKLHGSFEFDPARYTVVFSVDGANRSTSEYGWDENKLYTSAFEEDWQAGEHELAFELKPLPLEAQDGMPENEFSRDPTNVRFQVYSVRVEGPLGTNELVHPPNYDRFFTRDEPPTDAVERRVYAEEVLRRFATRAFRGSVDSATIDRLVDVAETEYRRPDRTFEAGIARAMEAALASPRFLFRWDSVEPSSESRDYGPVDELSLASRLSYLLWSTMPDDELVRLAEAGQLRAELPKQLQRMTADARFEQFVENFAGQWLRTRDVTQTSVDPIVVLGFQQEYDELRQQFRRIFGRRRDRSEMSPEDQQLLNRFRELRAIADRFDDELKQAMRRETEMQVEYIAREDRSLLELIDCDYTFVNERLAEHYGIPDVSGREMRKISLPEDSPRGGVLTHASMLLVTSNPTRTSPVKRGLFVLDNILGTPAPPAPGGVPELENSAGRFTDKEPTLRELLAAHRESALCASCHARMDPLGLALENFDALGMWRDSEKDQPIDASGELITGESFQDIRQLKTILRERHADEFYRCLTQKLLTYAIGRGVEYTDEHTIDLIVRELHASGGKFSVLLQGVVESAPFQKQRLPHAIESHVSAQPLSANPTALEGS